ncbi:MAG: hypothetical protein ACODAU_04735 [Myxococcota bacterium]
MIARWTAALVIAAAAGCADEPEAAPAPEASAGAEQPAPPSGPPAPWSEMTFEQRKEHMKLAVLPAMEAQFYAFDADTYADFGCPTCHGADPEAHEFEMPSPDLPRLPSPESTEFEEMMAEPNAVVSFMQSGVVPTMADLLGTEPFDPDTGEGFGCFGCHTMEEAPGAPDRGSDLEGEEPEPALEADSPQ